VDKADAERRQATHPGSRENESDSTTAYLKGESTTSVGYDSIVATQEASIAYLQPEACRDCITRVIEPGRPV